MNQPLVSVIVPAKSLNDYIAEALPHLWALNYPRVEVLLVLDQQPPPDQVESLPQPPTEAGDGKSLSVLASGEVGPAQKRDLGAASCRGEILAFMDDDAYPARDWLDKATPHFQDPEVSGVGGPALTPPGSPFWERVSGAFFLSPLGGGNPDRYWPGPATRDIDDWPSVNLLVRKRDFLEVGGFDSRYWPGEDTQLCHELTVRLGKRLVYDPQALVWHHRRPGLVRHLRQVGRYGLHRGFFAKKFAATSARLPYFIPSTWLAVQVVLLLLLFWRPLLAGVGLVLAWAAYGLALASIVLKTLRRDGSLTVGLATIPYVILSHLYYGARFLQGFFFTSELNSQLRKPRGKTRA
jgi:cellulose synthase/poly-beta-1,6-N-acetylglucosamine synthase-like glycosyltransferase